MKDYRDKEMKNLIYMLFFLFLIWCTPILEHINDTEDKSKYAYRLNTASHNIMKKSDLLDR